MIRLAMADANTIMRQQLCAYLGNKPGIQVIASVGDGGEALQVLRERGADIMVLDLAMPVMDGLEVLRRIQHSPEAEGLKVIVLSCMMRDQLIAQAMRLGAVYYMIKPFDRELLYQRIMQFGAEETPTQDGSSGRAARAGYQLRHQGIAVSSKGMRYLRAMPDLLPDSRGDDLFVTKRAYPEVARHFGVDASNVERAIRSSIESAWQRGAMQRAGWFGGPRRPTNSEFIARLMDELG